MSRGWWLLALAMACSSSKDTQPAPPPAPKAQTPATPSRDAAAPAVDDGYAADALGALAFSVPEGSPDARAHFSRGLLAVHSFWYDEAIRQFEAAIAADPKMRMAYWGLAMAHCKLLWGEDDVRAAKKALTSMPDAETLPPREQAWVSTMVELLLAPDVRTSRKKFAAAMEQLNAAFPDDESATFLAAALLASTRPEDPDHQQVRERAAQLALGVYQHNPKHPGAAHYLIHAYDTPAMAQRALPLARAYAEIAPAAFHARHMPAHIFSRLGMWSEAIKSCRAAWDASVVAAKRLGLSADHYDFHSLNWLVEMSFEVGRRKDADAALELWAQAVRGGLGRQQRSAYADQIASYLTRTGEWTRVDELLKPLEAPAVDESGPDRAASLGQCTQPVAMSQGELMEQSSVLDTRIRAAAGRKDVALTTRLLADSDALFAKLRPVLEASQAKAEVDAIVAGRAQWAKLTLARAHDDPKALLAALRTAVPDADREEAAGTETLQRGSFVREEIAGLLLRTGKRDEAAAEYERVLVAHPNRARALLGAARATRDAAVAHRHYQELAAQWVDADPGTDGLDEARAAK